MWKNKKRKDILLFNLLSWLVWQGSDFLDIVLCTDIFLSHIRNDIVNTHISCSIIQSHTEFSRITFAPIFGEKPNSQISSFEYLSQTAKPNDFINLILLPYHVYA